MDSDNSNEVVVDLQKEQMLKLITRGFYKELINYGIDKIPFNKYVDKLLQRKTA